jgi:hypothetical protein
MEKAESACSHFGCLTFLLIHLMAGGKSAKPMMNDAAKTDALTLATLISTLGNAVICREKMPRDKSM